MRKRGLILILASMMLFLLAVDRLETDRQAIGVRQLEDSLRRAAVSCYAAEGFYPPDIAYLQTHYGLRYDEASYIIHYQFTASNWMPEITVLERES